MSLTPAQRLIRSLTDWSAEICEGMTLTLTDADREGVRALLAQLEAQAAPRTYERCTSPDCDCGFGKYRCKPNVVREVSVLPETMTDKLNRLQGDGIRRVANLCASPPDSTGGAEAVGALPAGWTIERLSETKLKVSLAGDVTAIVKESDFGTNIPAYALYGLASDLLAAGALPGEPAQ